MATLATEQTELIKGNARRVEVALQASLERFMAALPRAMDPQRWFQLTVMACFRQPKLLECTPASIVLASLQAAELGLEPGPMGYAWFIPRENKHIKALECQFQPGYRGLMKLARQGGEIKSIYAHVVHKNDPTFVVRLGLEKKLEHEPCLSGEPGELIYVYAVAKLEDGDCDFEILSVAEVEKIRKASASPNAGPWVSWWDEMAKKSAIKRLCKRLPVSVELAKAIDIDNEEYREALAHQPAPAPTPHRKRLGVEGVRSGLTHVGAILPSIPGAEAEAPPQPPEDPLPAATPEALRELARKCVPAQGVDDAPPESDIIGMIRKNFTIDEGYEKGAVAAFKHEWNAVMLRREDAAQEKQAK